MIQIQGIKSIEKSSTTTGEELKFTHRTRGTTEDGGWGSPRGGRRDVGEDGDKEPAYSCGGGRKRLVGVVARRTA